MKLEINKTQQGRKYLLLKEEIKIKPAFECLAQNNNMFKCLGKKKHIFTSASQHTMHSRYTRESYRERFLIMVKEMFPSLNLDNNSLSMFM